MTDKQLNKGLKKNNKTVLKYLFNTYHKQLFRYAYKLTLNKEISEEIVQDIFISLWEKRNEREIENFEYYLLRAVKYRSINYIKQKSKSFGQSNENTVSINSGYSTPQQELEGKELAEAIDKAMLQLPKKCAIIFSLSRNSEMSYKEIAEELDISIKTVENQIGIALKKLREMLNVYINT